MPATRSKADFRRELGLFFRDRRAKLSPGDVGLPGRGARRTPGLRREEVAALAGVSVSWYTWLEQGRDVRASPEILDRVASALALTSIERAHVQTLVAAPETHPPPDVALHDGLRRLVDSLGAVPAYVLDERTWDVIAWNPAAEALYAFSARPGAERNVLRMLFMDARLRAALVDWRSSAAATVARFRMATAAFRTVPEHVALVRDLAASSPEFGAMWGDVALAARTIGVKAFAITGIGVLAFEHNAFLSRQHDATSLVTYTPIHSTTIARRFAALVERSKRAKRRTSVKAR